MSEKNYKNSPHEVNTDGFDLSEGLHIDGFEKLENLNNVILNVIQLKEDKTLKYIYISNNKKRK